MKRPSKEVRALARRAAALAEQASLDGLDAPTAVMAAAISVSFEQMSRADIADWFRRLADEMEGDAARIRHLLRHH
jgi:hypothetical protein